MPGVPARLRTARQEAGYRSAVAAAQALGWPEPAYRHHENGTRNFDSALAEVYGRAFGVSPVWLLGLGELKREPANASTARTAGIPWRPIAELPDALKDGREVLVWDAWPYVASWEGGDWRIQDWIPVGEPTHFAEINAPEEHQ
ncbi:helix-turn-helix domain-containing protein [Sphingomonas sp.]|uniref:helix-turn-helix domain-containing protein n=1 Tax=Sphingomonas sp. TaxID=28214 RepID=UPI003FA73DAF